MIDLKRMTPELKELFNEYDNMHGLFFDELH
jgi:hypothetical protein